MSAVSSVVAASFIGFAPSHPAPSVCSIIGVALVAVASRTVFIHPSPQCHHVAKKFATAHSRIAEPPLARWYIDITPLCAPTIAPSPIVTLSQARPVRPDVVLDDDTTGDAALRDDD